MNILMNFHIWTIVTMSQLTSNNNQSDVLFILVGRKILLVSSQNFVTDLLTSCVLFLSQAFINDR